MNREGKKKGKKRPLNQERRMKQMLEKEPEKKRGMPVPPSKGHKDKRREKRKDVKRKLREHTGSRHEVANSLVKMAKELTAAKDIYDYATITFKSNRVEFSIHNRISDKTKTDSVSYNHNPMRAIRSVFGTIEQAGIEDDEIEVIA